MLSGVALFHSCSANSLAEQSNSIAASANAVASDSAKKQGGLVQILPGMIVLQQADGHWNTYPPNPDGSLHALTLEEWRNARGWAISVRLENNGLQEGFPEEYYFVTGNSNQNRIYSSVSHAEALDLKCRHLNDEWAPCPEKIDPQDGYSLTSNIPKDFLQQLADNRRQQGLTLCVRSRSGGAECGTIQAVIPAGAADVMP